MRDTDYEVAEDAVGTLERLVSEGDVQLASLTYEIMFTRVSKFCNPEQFERLRAVEIAIGEARSPPRPRS